MSDTANPGYAIPEEDRHKLEHLLAAVLPEQREEWLKTKVCELYRETFGHDMLKETTELEDFLLNELPPDQREANLKSKIFYFWKCLRDAGRELPG